MYTFLQVKSKRGELFNVEIHRPAQPSDGMTSLLVSNSRKVFLQSLLRQGIDAFAPRLRRNCEFFV
jgi:hypothetical protein